MHETKYIDQSKDESRLMLPESVRAPGHLQVCGGSDSTGSDMRN